MKCFKKATRRKFPQDGKKGKSCCNWEHRGPPEEPRLSITALTVAAPLLPVGVPVTPTPFSLEAGVAKHLYVASGARTLPTQDSPPLSLPVPTHWASLRSSSGPSGGTAARGPGCPASCGTVTPAPGGPQAFSSALASASGAGPRRVWSVPQQHFLGPVGSCSMQVGKGGSRAGQEGHLREVGASDSKALA